MKEILRMIKGKLVFANGNIYEGDSGFYFYLF
jgi:hypothetical protein